MSTQADALTVCENILRRKSRSFRLASSLLSPRVRAATVVLYAYCRRCDDAVDELRQEPDAMLMQVAKLMRELDRVYAGEPQQEPVLAAFQAVITEYRIPRLYFDELIAGMNMDASGARYETLGDLLLYCHRVAGTVGLMMCHVLGVRDAWALKHAAHLGIAMQLTNICRDVREDFELGRVYLPARLLASLGSEPLDPAAGTAVLYQPRTRQAVVEAVRTLLAESRRYYHSGDLGLRALPFRSALAVRAARLLYAAIGTRLRLAGYDPLRGRAVTPGSWKAALVLRALFVSLCSLPRRLDRLGHRTPALPSQHVVRFPDDVLPL